MKVTPHYSTQETLQFTYDSVFGILQSNIPGCLVECGVASGSQIGAMQECLQTNGAKREIYGFDSFCGIPYAGDRDTEQPGIGPIDRSKLGLLETTGVSAHSKECVLSNFEKWGLKTNHLTLIEGWFENTVPMAKTGPIAMLRLDGDLYSSTKVCMKHLYPLLVPNGILIIDDYILQGCRDAIHEYIPEREIINIYGIGYYIKPAKFHSQNNEAEKVMSYFGGAIGSVLDIGANDGKTFSNSYDLIKLGWSGTLIEPSSSAFKLLSILYKNNLNVKLLNIAISNQTGYAVLYESGPHVSGGNDVALVSTLLPSEIDRWRNVEFTPENIRAMTVLDAGISGTYDFISIDCEGLDLIILEQLDLRLLGCKCVCIEYNSDFALLKCIKGYCLKHGLNKVLLQNAENIILTL